MRGWRIDPLLPEAELGVRRQRPLQPRGGGRIYSVCTLVYAGLGRDALAAAD
ncbi:hypothetical protein IscW_ISCW001426 [Ixodes scapularis]|uniref:Uncharacterized protein n=1 Tax=Ixodes scapularis TaxID=6945 RepID=B7P273_IXOSC|nr:hypothetical protein IscW_ISCW001426 [Ixodes scapularis]|eukprot:XP_002401623.1 hypothetical protein IscW_ISCW001426 [Ixodes scapularis]